MTQSTSLRCRMFYKAAMTRSLSKVCDCVHNASPMCFALSYFHPPRQKCSAVSVDIFAAVAGSVVFGSVVLRCVVLVGK